MATASLKPKLGLVKVSALGAGILLTLAAAPAQAANFSGTVANLRTAGFSALVGDKIYSDFVVDASLNNTDTVQISDGGANHTIALSNAAGWDPGTYGFSYKVTSVGTNKFAAYGASASSSIFGPPLPVGTISLTGGAGLVSQAVNAGIAGPAFYAVPPSFDTFTTALIVTAGKVTLFDNTLTQTFDDSKVPGPLSILGAGAAFGFSRKLRKRIKATV